MTVTAPFRRGLAAGATWWIESVRARPGWQEAIAARLRAAGQAGR